MLGLLLSLAIIVAPPHNYLGNDDLLAPQLGLDLTVSTMAAYVRGVSDEDVEDDHSPVRKGLTG